MRNINELLASAKEVKQEHTAAIAQFETDIQKAKADIEQSAASAAAALSVGDQKTFSDCKNAEKFHRERLAYLEKQKNGDFYTVQTNNAIVEEVLRARKTENQPLYEHLWKLADEWNATIRKIGSNNAKVYDIDVILRSMIPENINGRQRVNYETIHSAARVPELTGEIIAALELNCKRPAKKEGE